ncbi:MAG: ABC transporter permease, partial [Opitutaceae bacterium]
SGLAAVSQNNVTRAFVATPGSSVDGIPVQALDVSGNFFSVLGVPAHTGRVLTADDDAKGSARAVVVLSHAFWQRQFGGDPSVVGANVLLDKVSFQIVGVAARGFLGADPTRMPVDLWFPVQLRPLLEPTFAGQLRPRSGSVFFLIGRLKAGVAVAAAVSELDVIFQRWMIEVGYSETQRTGRGKIELEAGGRGRIDRKRGGKIEFAAILVGIVGLVLLLACANVASLLLTRIANRRREFGVRSALGASRGRLIRQLLTEIMSLVVAGSALGLLLPVPINLAIRSFSLGVELDTTPNATVLLLTLVVSLGTGVCVALLPALQFSRVDLREALHSGSSRAGSRQWLGKALVVLQLAVSVCLLVGTGLFVRTLQNLKNVDLGFARENLLVAVLSFDRSYDGNRQSNLGRELLEALAALPGVNGASLSGGGAWTNGRLSRAPVTVEGYTPQRDEDMSVNVGGAGPEALSLLRVPLVRGRDLTAADVFQTVGTPGANATGVAIVNEAVVRRFFGGGDPIGRQITVSSRRFEVVGVAKATRYSGLRDNGGLQVYVPYFHLGPQESLSLVLRTAGEPSRMASAVSAAITRIDPKIPIARIAPLEDAVNRAVAPERTIANLAGGFGLFALFAGLPRPLRSARLQRGPAHARDWHPHGIGCGCARGANDDRRARHATRTFRLPRGLGDCGVLWFRDVEAALRRIRGRSGNAWRRRAAASAGGVDRVLGARTTRYKGRSDGGVAGGVRKGPNRFTEGNEGNEEPADFPISFRASFPLLPSVQINLSR